MKFEEVSPEIIGRRAIVPVLGKLATAVILATLVEPQHVWLMARLDKPVKTATGSVITEVDVCGYPSCSTDLRFVELLDESGRIVPRVHRRRKGEPVEEPKKPPYHISVMSYYYTTGRELTKMDKIRIAELIGLMGGKPQDSRRWGSKMYIVRENAESINDGSDEWWVSIDHHLPGCNATTYGYRIYTAQKMKPLTVNEIQSW